VGHTLVYGNPALVQEDPVERMPYYHVLPGSWVLSIATAGCNLACQFCEVWDMALVAPEDIHAYDMLPEKVVAHAKASGVRAVSYAFGEPVAFYEYMAEVAVLAKQAGLVNLAHTAGYIQPKPLMELIGKLDAVNVDLKGFDQAFYREIVGGELEPVLATLKMIRARGLHLEITNVVIPTLNDDLALVSKMCHWIVKELGADVPVHFARFYPLFKLSALPRTPVSTMDQVRDTALAAGLKFVYIAKIPGHIGENTFCPGCQAIVIKRLGFVIEEIKLNNGACAYCGTAIPGRWV
jgi:pyruvate formate lyase activating enzyme